MVNGEEMQKFERYAMTAFQTRAAQEGYSRSKRITRLNRKTAYCGSTLRARLFSTGAGSRSAI